MNATEMSSDVDDDEPPPRRRSIWVWLIFGWALWSVLGMFGMWWQVFHPLSDAELAAATALWGASAKPAARLTAPTVTVMTVNALVLLAGAWKLFMLRAVAVRIFWAAAIIGVVISVLVNMITIKNYPAFLLSPLGLGGLVFALAFYAVLLWYSTRLLRRGVLR